VSLYMYGFDVVNTCMSCMELSPESGAQVRMNDGYVTQTPTAGRLIATRSCHEVSLAFLRSGLQPPGSHVPRLDAHAHLTLSYLSNEAAASS
jgi:hypothetical protein